jgi:hypothetical protein
MTRPGAASRAARRMPASCGVEDTTCAHASSPAGVAKGRSRSRPQCDRCSPWRTAVARAASDGCARVNSSKKAAMVDRRGAEAVQSSRLAGSCGLHAVLLRRRSSEPERGTVLTTLATPPSDRRWTPLSWTAKCGAVRSGRVRLMRCAAPRVGLVSSAGSCPSRVGRTTQLRLRLVRAAPVVVRLRCRALASGPPRRTFPSTMARREQLMHGCRKPVWACRGRSGVREVFCAPPAIFSASWRSLDRPTP